jgi:uncharacterized protein
MSQRPVPVPDPLSAPYWSAAAEHVLVLARCSTCATFALPPGVVCGTCQTPTPDFTYQPVSGRGTVRSWTVLHDSFLPGFEDDLPLVLVDVELDEQADLRMVSRLLDGPEAPLRLGDRVTVAFEDLASGVSVPAFVLDPSSTAAP